MSWQCPNCETVNQDITPVCTVCDHLSPVVDSFLSLESIEKLRDYNDKLEEVHALEIAGKYEEMVEASVKAMSLYRENDLAIEKAHQGLKKLQISKLEKIILSLLEDALEKKNLNLTQGILKMIDILELSTDKLEKLKKEVKKKISRKKDVDEILQKSYLALINLDTDSALRIIEEGLIIHTASKRLQNRRKEIQTFIQNLNIKKESKTKPSRPHPKPKTPSEGIVPGQIEVENIKDKVSKEGNRKFPKVRRNI
ncbi:MAG: hypothetical protein K2J82_07105 [Muribaculaceae bacterium]|nr:hypothetical protein [Muribaculaceae bacterium]MDE6754362.1 hypothetical protein [Muribaculaceae bacterium]